MTRLALTLIASLCFLAPAPATPSARKDLPPLGKDPPAGVEKTLSRAFTRAASTPAEKGAFRITDETEVLLDGRPCKYRDVPANAGVLKLEVGLDNRTVLKIHFRTRK